MMVYRVSPAKFANDLTGEGARLFGGRWNHKLTACLYTSESRALAILEYTVNVNLHDIPRALSIITIDIPARPFKVLSQADLPGNWKHYPAPSSTKDLGTRLLSSAKYPAIKIPSTIIPAEFNYLLNPLHPDIQKFKIIDIMDLPYDVRIK